MIKKHIFEYSRDELITLFNEFGYPKFRASQVYDWLHKQNITNYRMMTNLPKNIIEKLESISPLNIPEIFNCQISDDGTRKYVLKLSDSSLVEAVAMPSYGQNGDVSRLSICFSSQVGCAMGCPFCATGYEGFTRNLLPYEIYYQVLVVGQDFGSRVSNLVAMGQGEPFQNYRNTFNALNLLNQVDGLNIGARHITISTCGVISGISKLANEKQQYTLALSLHSAIQESRNILIPRLSTTSLVEIKKSLSDYTDKTNRRVSLEYLLIKDINDNKEHLDALIRFCDGLLCHVNLLLYNPVEESGYKPSSKKVLDVWAKTLSKNKIPTSTRIPRGVDINGACGQLKNKLI